MTPRLLLLAALTLPLPAFAQEAPSTTQPAQPARPAPATRPVIERTLTINGTAYRYRAATDFIVLKDDAGKPQARFFHTSYTLITDTPREKRPVTFVFNGGPGSSSVWLHLGAVGPRRVEMGDNALPPPPPGRIEDNPDTWLPDSDLVFVDPVGTGYSRAEPGVDARQYYSVEGDVASIGEFIRIYLTKHDRWGSPKFLAGESYGTTRSAALANHLARRQGIELSGIILISSVLEFSTIRDQEGNDLPPVLFLPSYTATAYFHKKLPADLQARKLEDVLKEVEAFAVNEYLPALAQGAANDPERRKLLAARIARYTGLDAAWVERNNARVSPSRFFKTLLADRRTLIGRFDGTITGPDTDPGDSRPEFDPSYTAYQGAYTSAINHYFTTELHPAEDGDTRYEILAGLPWTYPQGTFVNTASDLADALTTNPHLRVLVTSGHQDLATPYFATDFTLARLNIPPEARQRITVRHYHGGHMMYHYPASREQLADDARAFLRGATDR